MNHTPVKKCTTKNPITVVSLFSGCGGMDLGFLGGFDFLGKHYTKTDFDIIWSNEINPAACETYRTNLGDHIIVGDINEKLHSLPDHADVVIDDFPCQDISINSALRANVAVFARQSWRRLTIYNRRLLLPRA
jgi:DNA (cytosine-5)-methyltransferase 1